MSEITDFMNLPDYVAPVDPRAAESPAPTDAAAQKESFVRGEMGMAAADRAQTKLKRPRTKDNANV